MTISPHSVTVRTTDFDSVSDGSNPSVAANIEEEIHDYRAHRFAITQLANGDFALFDPSGDFIRMGPISDLASSILSGPQHYDQCVDNWISRPRSNSSEGLNLLNALGLAKPQQTVKIERRF